MNLKKSRIYAGFKALWLGSNPSGRASGKLPHPSRTPHFVGCVFFCACAETGIGYLFRQRFPHLRWARRAPQVFFYCFSIVPASLMGTHLVSTSQRRAAAPKLHTHLGGLLRPRRGGLLFCQGFSLLRLEGGDENRATFHRAEKCAGSTSFSLWVGSQRFRQQQVAAPKSYRISHPVVCVFSCTRAGAGLFLSTSPAAPRTFCRLWRLFS